jgi:hypothetical protein
MKITSIVTATCAALVAAGVSAGAAYVNRERVTISYDHNAVNEASSNTPVYVHQTAADVRESGGMAQAWGRWSPTWQDMFVNPTPPVYGAVAHATLHRAPAARRHYHSGKEVHRPQA